jgi:hypothetical protein
MCGRFTFQYTPGAEPCSISFFNTGNACALERAQLSVRLRLMNCEIAIAGLPSNAPSRAAATVPEVASSIDSGEHPIDVGEEFGDGDANAVCRSSAEREFVGRGFRKQ